MKEFLDYPPFHVLVFFVIGVLLGTSGPLSQDQLTILNSGYLCGLLLVSLVTRQQIRIS
jgi:hypothetical protein